jgi:hypothetical protein
MALTKSDLDWAFETLRRAGFDYAATVKEIQAFTAEHNKRCEAQMEREAAGDEYLPLYMWDQIDP